MFNPLVRYASIQTNIKGIDRPEFHNGIARSYGGYDTGLVPVGNWGDKRIWGDEKERERRRVQMFRPHDRHDKDASIRGPKRTVDELRAKLAENPTSTIGMKK